MVSFDFVIWFTGRFLFVYCWFCWFWIRYYCDILRFYCLCTPLILRFILLVVCLFVVTIVCLFCALMLLLCLLVFSLDGYFVCFVCACLMRFCCLLLGFWLCFAWLFGFCYFVREVLDWLVLLLFESVLMLFVFDLFYWIFAWCYGFIVCSYWFGFSCLIVYLFGICLNWLILLG